MSPNIIKYIFYTAILLSIIWHTTFLFTLFHFHKIITIALERNNACKIHQTEGETVRYTALKAFHHSEKYYKNLGIIFTVLIFILLLCSLYFMYKTNLSNDIPISHIIFAILISIVSIIDTILISIAFQDIYKANADYDKNRKTIINALKQMNENYPMFQNTSEYPGSLDKFYNVLLKRWVSYHNELTMDEGKSSLIDEASNNHYDLIYEVFKFDLTFDDRRLFIQNYNMICGTNTLPTCSPRLPVEDALNMLQSYAPAQKYKDFQTKMRTFFIYGIILFLIFIYPLFHLLYTGLTPALLGIFVIIIISIGTMYGYYTFMYAY